MTKRLYILKGDDCYYSSLLDLMVGAKYKEVTEIKKFTETETLWLAQAPNENGTLIRDTFDTEEEAQEWVKEQQGIFNKSNQK